MMKMIVIGSFDAISLDELSCFPNPMKFFRFFLSYQLDVACIHLSADHHLSPINTKKKA